MTYCCSAIACKLPFFRVLFLGKHNSEGGQFGAHVYCRRSVQLASEAAAASVRRWTSRVGSSSDGSIDRNGPRVRVVLDVELSRQGLTERPHSHLHVFLHARTTNSTNQHATEMTSHPNTKNKHNGTTAGYVRSPQPQSSLAGTW